MTRKEASYILQKFYADGYKSNNYNTLEQALQLAVICLEIFPHWISVEDELPKEHFKDSSSKWVLVCTPLGSVYIDSYNHKNKEWVNNRKSVTHWMPMPAPPHHIIDANKKVDRVIGTADHIKTALDVLNKKGGEK